MYVCVCVCVYMYIYTCKATAKGAAGSAGSDANRFVPQLLTKNVSAPAILKALATN